VAVDRGVGAERGVSRAGPHRARTWRRRVRWKRRLLGLVALAAPTGFMVFGELVRRADRLAALPRDYKLAWAGGALESFGLWALLLFAASRRRGAQASLFAGLFLALFTLVLGTEGAFYAVWNTYLTIDGQLHSKNLVQSLVGTLPLGRLLVVFHFVAALLFGAFALRFARHVVRPRAWAWNVATVIVPAALVGVAQIPTSYRGIQASPPDALYVHGYAGLVKEHLARDPYLRERFGLKIESPDRRVQRRDPEPVPALASKPARPRNVLLVLEESQRGDVVCAEYDPRCPLATPWSNLVVPNRIALNQLRANASTTAISISNLWSGVSPTESRELLHAVPLMWEYAAAAGYDTAYWTSQNLMFGNARQYVQDLPLSRGCVATHLDPHADFDAGAHDELLSRRVREELGELEEPFFAVVHYSNPHFPYVFDDEIAPFRPAVSDTAAEKNDEYFNYYRDVVMRSDLAVAELVRAVRASKAGPRTVIVYTADHGESFREHWQMGHTSALYDEEVLVKGWLDAPPGTLAPEEEANVRQAGEAPIWHLDLAPTFLDLMGVWDDPALAPFRARMVGHPITRAERTVGPVPMTNCTWVWECAFRNWGLMQGSRKLEAREWDGAYRCFDTAGDPKELVDLGERGCGPLPDVARELYRAMPDVTPPGRPNVDWGK